MEGQLLTPYEVAELLQVSNAKAYNILRTGNIPILRLGRLVRVRREDLELYIRETVNWKDAKGVIKNAPSDHPSTSRG